MGRPSLGARWWHDKSSDTIFLRDRVDGQDVKYSMGFGKRDEPDWLRRAEAELVKYVAAKHAVDKSELKHQSGADVLVSDVLIRYVSLRIEEWQIDYPAPPSRPKEVRARLKVLGDFFDGWTVDELDDDAVKEFVRYLDELTLARETAKGLAQYEKAKSRRDWKPEDDNGPVKRELKFNPKAAIRYIDDLNAAIALSHKKSKLRHLVKVTAPKDYNPRKAVFTRGQIARLIWTAYRKRGLSFIDGQPKTDAFIWRHLARFLLVAIYTGSRKSKVWRVSFTETKDRPWTEFKRLKDRGTWTGTLHRLGEDEVEYKTKLAPSIPLPGRLTAHFMRWKKMGLSGPCEDPTGHIGDPSGAMDNLFDEVLGSDRKEVIHTLRHTAATWLVSRAELPLAATAQYLGMSVETLLRRYAKVLDRDQRKIGRAFTQSRIGSDLEDDVDGVAYTVGRIIPGKVKSGRQILTDTDRNGLNETG